MFLLYYYRNSEDALQFIRIADQSAIPPLITFRNSQQTHRPHPGQKEQHPLFPH